ILQLPHHHLHTIIPAYTHLQPPQPISFPHHIITYFSILERHKPRFLHTLKPIHISPLPPPPLTPTTHPIHTHLTQQLLPFPNLYQNTLHPLTHPHYILQTFHHISLTIVHLSLFPQQIIFSSTHEPKFITLS
ncbi:lyase family protein, partial [Staphylococcus epidermidis]|uniref:lyase family protein n=1 Tax=Staphylococcus epidermidis TaxID=1282 RepID=UPI0028CB1680